VKSEEWGVKWREGWRGERNWTEHFAGGGYRKRVESEALQGLAGGRGIGLNTLLGVVTEKVWGVESSKKLGLGRRD
jgi:hypothetical protein